MSDKSTNAADGTPEMNLEVLWQIEKKPGKAVKLYLKNKQQEFKYKIEKEGRYSLALHTPDSLPGGAAGRKVEALVSVYRSTAEAPALEASEELKDYALGDSFTENVILRDTYEVHSKQKTTVAEFEIKESELPATIHVIAKTHTPLIGMRFSGKLYRNANLSDVGHHSGMDFGDDDDWMFETLSLNAIKKELNRDSEYKTRAFEAGFIRPFQWLVSMHPIMRIQIGDLMGIKLIDLKGDEKWSHDPHAQADRILLKHLKGLGSIADHMYETANPISSKSNWYDCLHRGNTEVRPEDHGTTDLKVLKDTETACKEQRNSDMLDLERTFLESARKMHLNEIGKLEKDTTALTDQVEEYLKEPEVIQMLDTMKEYGVKSDDCRRFVVEICVANEYKLWCHYHEMEQEAADQEKDDAETMVKKWAASKKNTEVVRDDSYEENHAVLGGIRAQVMRGTYDPRGMSESSKALAKKAGQMVAKKAFKHFVLTPMFPFLVLPWDIAGLADKVLGSDHQTVWLVSLQISLQKLLLAAHGISIEDSYSSLANSSDKK